MFGAGDVQASRALRTVAGKRFRKAALRKQIWKGFNAHVRRAKLLKKGEAEG